MVHNDENNQTHVLYQLYSMIINILTLPPLPIPLPFTTPAVASTSTAPSLRPPRVTPPGFAALFLAVSFAMMMFGFVVFVIGFMLMPLIVALVMLFYLAGFVSNLANFACALLCPSTKIVSAWKLS